MTNKRQLPADLFETIKKVLNVGLYGDIPYDFPYSISVNQYKELFNAIVPRFDLSSSGHTLWADCLNTLIASIDSNLPAFPISGMTVKEVFVDEMNDNKKPIDNVTIDVLGVSLSAFGVNLSHETVDLIIDVVELIEDMKGEVKLSDLYKLQKERRRQ